MDQPHHASGERDHIAMRTLTVVRQYLAAAFLLVIGLVAYGCGDSATVNPVVELASLTVDPGTLQPAFSGGTTQYNVDVSSNITSATITAQPAVAGDSVTINGQSSPSVIQLGAAGTTTPVSVVVSESGTNSRTYTVLFVRAGLTGNNSLQNLTVSSGTLAPTFDENTQDYTVDVASNVGSINVTPTLDDPNATMTVNGQATNSGQPRTISLNPAGQSTLITTVVTAQNSSNKTYRITVSRGVSSNNNLRGLTVSPGTLSPAFNENRTSTSYEVNNVASSVTSVTVTPTLRDTTASMTVNGQATNSGQARTIPLGAAGSNTPIFIIVTAQNGTQKTYTAGVSRAALGGNNNLSALAVSPGSLDSAFNANDLSYTVNVGNTVASIIVTPTRQDPNATITVTPPGTGSGQARTIPLNGAGSNTLINIVVTAPNGSQKTYSVNVIRAALGGNNNLSALTVTPGPLAPTFTQNTLNYTVNVASTVTSVTVSATKSDPNAVMSGDVTAGAGTATGSSPSIQLGGPGTSRVVSIAITAPNGSSKTYTITVQQAAQASNNNLSALTVTPGPLAPTFTQNTLNYTANVANTVTSVTVSATKSDPNAVMSEDVTAGSGTATGQATIQLDGPGTATIVLITVTAQNSSSKTYRITVNRAAPASNNNLSALTVSPGSLTPSFAAGTESYTAGVATDVSSINVSATKADPNAVMSGSVTAGTGVPTGQATIPLNGAGTSTSVSITVTAPNGNSKTYSITVNRALAEPPAPASAPDLVEADDSCPLNNVGGGDPTQCLPGTSRVDNVTNFTTPRFSIPQPGSGETANLYVDGNKVPSSFNSGDNTLRPNAPLPDGGYDITYTFSNSGGESDPSPVMTPQLRIITTPPPPPRG